VPDYLLLKLASRCNISCTYCYWFRDQSVYAKPALLTQEAEAALLRRLREHVVAHELEQFSILLHGGEPLLLGKARTRSLLDDLRSLEHDLGFRLQLRITTNGLLVDDEWVDILNAHEVGVTISLDGPENIHDKSRLDFRRRGTHARVIRALEILRARGADPGVLAVCDPAGDARALLRYFADELDVQFDVLVPDATHEDRPASIARFYCELFDEWYDRYAERGVEIRFLSSVVKGLLGVPSRSESIGMGEITTMTMLTDGSLEALDILRTSRTPITASALNIIDDPLDAINDDPLWAEVRDAAVTLAEPCRSCAYEFACGGGHIASRWSPERRYDNPSVYCDDFMTIFAHVWGRLAPDMQVELDDQERIPLGLA
jgi:uncharacterized protein